MAIERTLCIIKPDAVEKNSHRRRSSRMSRTRASRSWR